MSSKNPAMLRADAARLRALGEQHRTLRCEADNLYGEVTWLDTIAAEIRSTIRRLNPGSGTLEERATRMEAEADALEAEGSTFDADAARAVIADARERYREGYRDGQLDRWRGDPSRTVPRGHDAYARGYGDGIAGRDYAGARVDRPAKLLDAARDARALLNSLLTDSQLDHVQPGGGTARQRLEAIDAAVADAEREHEESGS